MTRQISPQQDMGQEQAKRSRRGMSPRALLLVANGVIFSVGGVYLVTESISAIIVGGVLGVTLAGWLASVSR